MSNYRPSSPFVTPLMLLIPTYKTVKGVPTKKYPEIDEGELIWCSFKTYGGTERATNDVYSIEDTANIETWYRPDIKGDCRIAITDSKAIYEIINEPEDIDQHHQYCKFKVKRIKGGA